MTPPQNPPATPLTLIAVALTNPARVALNWTDAATNEASMELQRCAGVSCSGFVALQTLSRNEVSTVDSTVVTGATYRYRIRAINSVGPSPWSNIATVAMLNPAPTPLPPAPTVLTATPASTQITLSAVAASNVDTYTFKRGLSSGSETTLISGLASPAYVNTGLTNGTRYFYTCHSVKDGIESLASNEVSAVPPPPTPPANPTPPTLSATPGTGQVVLSWSFVSGASYTLKRGTTSGGEATIATGLTGTNYTDTGLTGGTAYFYVVTATVSGVTSAASNEVTATPTTPVTPPSPTPDPTLTKYVATTGSNFGLGSFTDPWLTFRFAVAQVTAGMTLYIRGGTYTGAENTIDSEPGGTVPSGTSWSNAITIAGYPSETVIIRPPNLQHAIRLTTGAPHYLIFQDLILDGANQTVAEHDGGPTGVYVSSGANHNRFLRLEVKDWGGSGIAFSTNNGESGYNEVLQCSLHGNGSTDIRNSGYGMYVNTSNNVYDGNDIYGNNGYGIHINPHTASGNNNIIRNNKIHDNFVRGSIPGVGGVTSFGIAILNTEPISNNLVYNNLIYDNGYGTTVPGSETGGILIYNNVTDSAFYNNTIYHNNGEGIHLEYIGGNVTLRNNIIYSNRAAIVNYGGAVGSGTIIEDHNLTSDPIFVDASANDFRLQSTSPALNAGVTLSDVPYDIVGVPRPQGTAYDIGAYERIVV